MKKTRCRLLCVTILLLAGLAQARECIGVIPAGGGQSFWGEVEQGALLAGKELGIDIYFRGPQDEFHPDSQKKVIAIIEERNCIALVLAPNVQERNQDVARLKQRGIPTVYMDRSFDGNDAVAIVATNHYKAGRLAAQYMGELLKGHGRIAIFRMQQGVQSTDERERGFLDASKRAGLSIVNQTWLSSNVGTARTRSLEALSQLSGKIDGVFTPNESTTLATLLSLKQLGLNGKIKFIGFDIRTVFSDALKEKSLSAVIVQKPHEMGYQSVQIAYRAAKGHLPAQKKHEIDVEIWQDRDAKATKNSGH